MRNLLKEKLRRNELALGLVHFAAGCADTIDVMGQAGIDWVTIDTEHACNSIYELQGLVRAADAAGITPIVRFMEIDRPAIQQVLDAGAGGVIVSHITTPEQAAEVVRAAKYAPIGQRGACPTIRATGYDPEDWEEYTAAANKEVIVNVLVEEKEGFERIDEILSVPGVDVVFFGNFDLSLSLGLPGETRWDHPVLAAALQRVVKSARARGVWVQVSLGTKFTQDPDYARTVAKAGVNLIGCGSDLLLLSRACQGIVNMKDQLGDLAGRTRKAS
jgi:4-hydroxy-2-oxoheptanedioate aldolase